MKKIASWASVVVLGMCTSAGAQSNVTPRDVKRFIDPTALVNRIEYTFDTWFLPDDIEAYNHQVLAVWAPQDRFAAWVQLPFTTFSIPGQDGSTGVGDVSFGWGVLVHENLARRFTSSVAAIEVFAPTGSFSDGTGAERWLLAPRGALAFNATDLFPIYVFGQYVHSIGGGDGAPVRALDLRVETTHLLPKGFYAQAIPTLSVDLEQDSNFFSLGVLVGRALTRSLAWEVGYAHRVSGGETFNHSLFFTISLILGSETAEDEQEARP